ncbi:hypothetical protein CCL24_05385 [Pseudomonas congelans]|nr:hypothetical protein CCL24_05385 [Pseudomonas congelans]
MRKYFATPITQPKLVNILNSAPEAVGVLMRADNIKNGTKLIDRFLNAQLITQHMHSQSSDITFP